MRRIVIIAASMAGVLCATRLKRRLAEDEVNLIVPANLDALHAGTGPVSKRIAPYLPNLEVLATRNLGVLDAHNIMTDLEKKEVTVSSSRGSLPVRFTDLVVEVQATARIPRAIQNAPNVLAWPTEGFFAQSLEYDEAILQAVQQNKTITVVGSGMVALDAILLCLEAGAKVHWLAPEIHQEPWIEDHLWHYLLDKLSANLTCTTLADTSIADLTCVADEATKNCTLLVDKNHNEYAIDLCLWTAPLMARHPLLREDGITLEPNGSIAIDQETQNSIHIIGSGAAVPSASLGNQGFTIPAYAGGEQDAFTTAAYAIAKLTGANEPFAGVYGLRKATGNDITVFRAGFTSKEAEKAQLEVVNATVAMPIEGINEGAVVMTLVCHAQTQTILGIQVLGFNLHNAITEGVFDTAFAALTENSSLIRLTTREGAGLPNQILARCANIVLNKCAGIIKGITPAELVASAEAGAEFFILDLRAQPEWEQRRLKNAYNIPLPQLKKRLQDEVPRFIPLVLVCETANDAYTVGCKLAGLGATEIYILDGGMQLWPYATDTSK